VTALRILIISTFFPPLNSIASLRPYSWAKRWSAQGHDVHILTTAKEEDPSVALNYPLSGFNLIEVPMPAFYSRLKGGNKPSSSEGKKSWTRSLFDHLRFRKGIFNAARMPDFTDAWAFKAFRAVKDHTWDLVVSTAGPYTVHLVAHRLKKKQRTKKWVADYRDTWSNNYLYPGIFPLNLFERWLEKHILQSSDLITTVSVPFANTFSQQYPHLQVGTIENGFDPEDLADLSPASIFPDAGIVRIVHTGSIYAGKRDPTPLFQAIQRMAQDPMQHALLNRLQVVFAGPRQANLEELIKKHQVEKWVAQVGFVSRSDALRMQRDAHALLFLAWNDPTVDGVLTGKIFEYLFSGTPIMSVGSTELEAAQQLIHEAKAGISLFSVSEIEQYLIKLLSRQNKETCPFQPDILQRYKRDVLADKLLEMANR
jgi:glycosyltransferase involved in cell wall biosynthesis